MSLYSARVAQDSPLFYFENNSSGVNNTGSITPTIVTGSSTTFTSSGGVSGSPYMVNAARTGEYGFEYSDSTTIFNDRVFSITGWFKVNSTDISTTLDYIFHAGTTAQGVFLQKTDKLYVAGIFNGVAVATSTAPSFDEWHHVAVTMDTTNLKLYVDGTLIQTVSSPGSLSMDSLVKYWGRATTSGTPRNGVKGNLDEWAVFNTTLSATTISEHYETGFGVLYDATPATASALAVDPVVSVVANISIVETPATATADIGDIQVSNFDTPTMLDGYLAGQSLEQWFKFDEIGKIHNYGSGGDAELAWAFNGASVNVPEAGIQGSGALKLKGEQGNTVVLAFGVNEPYSTEITDNEFSLGLWFKGESGFNAKNTALISFQNPFGTDNYTLRVNNVGFAAFQSYGSQVDTVTFNTVDLLDGNWHLIQARVSDTNNQIAISVDNGTEVTTAVNGNSWPQGIGYAQFGLTNDSGTNNQYGYISNMWITGYSSIGSTERAAMITAAAVPIQASAGMVQPVVKFDNAYNILLDTYSPKIAFRLNEASGAPINFGSGGTLSVGKNGSNITYLQPTQNTYAYKFTNADTFIQGDYAYASGTFSTSNHQTMSAVFKAESTVNFEQLIGSMGMYGFLGSGITLSIGATNGYLEARINQGFGPTDTDSLTTTINVCDNKYHHAVGVRDGSVFKLYLDGKEVASKTGCTTNLSDAATYAISGEGKFNFGQGSATKALHIDEFAVLSSALSATEVFDLYQSLSNATEWTASAAIVAGSVTTGTGVIANATALTASALSPFFIAPSIYAATANGLFQNPNYEAIDNVNIAHTAWTASAQADNPGFDIGEIQSVLHMDASAAMGNAIALIPGVWNASPAIVNAEMVDPAFSSTKGSIFKAVQMPAKAVFVSPPAYKLITDDIWYSKLYLQHSVVHGEEGYTAGSSSAYAFLKLFDDVTSSLSGAVTSKLTNNLPWSIVTDNPDTTATTVTYATASNEFLTATPTPVLEVGTYDDYERKSVRFRNTQFKIAEDIYKADGPYSLEFTFKTTKANQVIAQGLQRSFTGNQSATSSIGLIDGKLFASRATQQIGSPRIFAHPDNKDLVTLNTAYGNKAIADGAWHHIIIQYGFDGRVQFWIDGQLDIQFFADSVYGRGAKLRPYIIGSNHTNSRWQSDFETSAWSYDAAFFVESGDITEHYTSSIKYEPVAAEVATASAAMPEPVVAGNRGRALMLYFWPTSTEQLIGQFGFTGFTSTESPDELSTIDYFTSPPQDYEGWDIFPVDITGKYVSDLVKPEAYGVENISLTTFGGTVRPLGQGDTNTVKINKRRTFRDPLTDAPRYIDLINDIDLSKFDMIMFKNYPNDPAEKDSFTGTEVVDEYFNLRESAIFEEFVKSLRAAVDTGISLIVTNPQLALDLKIVDRVDTVPDMDDLSGYESDPYAPTQVPQAAYLPVTDGYPFNHHWWDTWKNNRSRVVNTQAGLTDNPGLIRTQIAFWNNDDNGVRYGGPDRPFVRYEHRDSLAVNDEFVISSESIRTTRKNFQASPISAVKAGKVITAFANTVRRGLDEITNPYKDYAISIAVNPGDILDGTQVGGKIFVNFTENINQTAETGDVDLISDYWVNYAYDNGVITLDERDAYLGAGFNIDETPYWSSDGIYILVQASEIQDENLQRKGNQSFLDSYKPYRKINKKGEISFLNVQKGGQYFALTYSYQYPRATLEVSSILTNGFRWLSNREVLVGTVIRPQAMPAIAEMPNAAGVPDRVVDFSAQSMVASALIEETQFSSGERKLLALPMEANATIVKPGSTIGVAPMTANAIFRLDSKAKVAAEDQVVLQVIHVDPILYIREDVIK
jgi:hypothetical protein